MDGILRTELTLAGEGITASTLDDIVQVLFCAPYCRYCIHMSTCFVYRNLCLISLLHSLVHSCLRFVYVAEGLVYHKLMINRFKTGHFCYLYFGRHTDCLLLHRCDRGQH